MAETQNTKKSTRRPAFIMLGLLLVVGLAAVAQPAAADDTRSGGGSSGVCILPVGPRIICTPDIRDGIAIQQVQSVRLPA